jgi:hypothetical protein
VTNRSGRRTVPLASTATTCTALVGRRIGTSRKVIDVFL